MGSTAELLQQWLDGAPNRAKEVASILRSAGFDEAAISRELRVRLGKAEPLRSGVPTFDSSVTRPASLMLRERFTFAGTIRDALEVWPSVDDMAKAMRRASVLRAVRSMAHHWEGSVPAANPPSRVTLFAYVPNESDQLTLLLWPDAGSGEPRVFRYAGQSERQFATLDEFLRWAAGI